MKKSNSKNLMLSVSAFSVMATVLQTFSSVIPASASNTPSPLEQKLCKVNGKYAVFAKERLVSSQRGGIADRMNVELAHEHIFYCENGRIKDNIGFGPDGRGIEDITDKSLNYILIDKVRYDSKIIKSIVDDMQDKPYCLIGNNCQDFAENVRQEYQRRTKLSINAFKTTVDLTKGSLNSTSALIPSLVTDEEGRGRTVILYTSEKYKNKGIIIHAMNPVPMGNITTVFFRFVKPNNAKISTTIDGFQINLVVSSNVKLTWYDNKSRVIGQKTIKNSGVVNIQNSGIARVQVGTLTEQDDEKFRINNFSFTLSKK